MILWRGGRLGDGLVMRILALTCGDEIRCPKVPPLFCSCIGLDGHKFLGSLFSYYLEDYKFGMSHLNPLIIMKVHFFSPSTSLLLGARKRRERGKARASILLIILN